MKKNQLYFLFVVLLLVTGACHPSSKQINGSDQLMPENFFTRFGSLTLPYGYGIDSLKDKPQDTVRLSPKMIAAFVPDSIWGLTSQQRGTTNFFPVGQTMNGQNRLVLIKSVQRSQSKVFLLIYGPADTLLASKEVASIISSKENDVYYFRLDEKHLLTLTERKSLSNGHVIVREWVYGLNEDGTLVLILTNSSEPAGGDVIYNPIDTFPRIEKYSGDYTSGKKGLVSIRDGGEPGTFQFYIHLNKNDGDCTGEVSGTGKMNGKTVGEFKDNDGPCGIRFTFSSTRVIIREIGGCGAYRGVSCYFEGTYIRKKESKKSSKP